MQVKPFPGIIQIEPDEVPEKTKTGLFVGDEGEESEKPMSATVLAIGKKVKHCKVGDRIFFWRANLGEIIGEDGKEKFYFVKNQDIVAVLED